ncbi:hypothetical protein F5887DRAFT_1161301 [Amanita rubescens]|nr:hypothetical protein F5887DRAFT_1161301 [Amanita rubescens]
MQQAGEMLVMQYFSEFLNVGDGTDVEFIKVEVAFGWCMGAGCGSRMLMAWMKNLRPAEERRHVVATFIEDNESRNRGASEVIARLAHIARPWYRYLVKEASVDNVGSDLPAFYLIFFTRCDGRAERIEDSGWAACVEGGQRRDGAPSFEKELKTGYQAGESGPRRSVEMRLSTTSDQRLSFSLTWRRFDFDPDHDGADDDEERKEDGSDGFFAGRRLRGS